MEEAKGGGNALKGNESRRIPHMLKNKIPNKIK